MFLDTGTKPEYLERTHTDTHANSPLKRPDLFTGIKPRICLLWGNSTNHCAAKRKILLMYIILFSILITISLLWACGTWIQWLNFSEIEVWSWVDWLPSLFFQRKKNWMHVAWDPNFLWSEHKDVFSKMNLLKVYIKPFHAWYWT